MSNKQRFSRFGYLAIIASAIIGFNFQTVFVAQPARILDFDGDGKCSNPNDVTVSGDFDGDGRADLAVYRWSTAEWWWKRSSDGQTNVVRFGVPQTDFPALADYDGDGKTDPTVWRENYGNPSYFHTLGSLSGYSVYQWGSYSDHVVSFEIMTH